MLNNFFSKKSCILLDNVKKRGTVWLFTDDNLIQGMRFECCIIRATNTHSEYEIFIAFPLQQWLHERASMLRYTYIDCIVKYNLKGLQALTFRNLASYI